MSVLYILVPLALCVAGLALAGFFWTIHDGQMDDLDSPAYRMLWDEDAKSQVEQPKQAAPRTGAAPDRFGQGSGDS